MVIVLLNFTSFSQKDTSRICFPYPVAQKIAIELVQKDSLQAELKVTQKILKENQTTIKFQDSVIVSFEKKEIEHKSEVKIFEEKEKNYKEKVTKLEGDNSTLSRKNRNLKTALQVVGGGFITTLSIIAAYIAIK